MTQTAETAQTATATGRRIFSIDAGQPFLPTLAKALVGGDLVEGFAFDPAEPTALADCLVLVPTRRAARALTEALLVEIAARGGGGVALLPDIRPFGDVEDDAPLFAADSDGLDPVISPLERRLAMTRLVMGWTRIVAADLRNPRTAAAPTLPASPAEAVRLAGSLLTLMDQVEAQGATWERLATIVPADHALYWQMTLAFLAIVGEAWPAHLAETGRDDPTRRRHAAVRATAARLVADPPKGPVIAAGSTGSVPSTADLIVAIAGLANGAVVLPGLDRDLDDDAWAALEPGPGRGDPVPSHPQYGLRLLLDRLGVDRDAVRRLGPAPTAREAARRRLLAEALRPAATSERWQDFAGEIAAGAFDLAAALDGLGLIEARNEAEEAVAVALALRQAIEAPTATAALVTPDRKLARRVAAELARWGIEIDDSAGRPFGHTAPMVFARLIGEVALGGFEPATVAALLSHPHARFGRDAGTAARLGRIVELIALRGPRAAPGGLGLLAAFDEAVAARRRAPHRVVAAVARIGEAEVAEARGFLADVVARLAPLEARAAAGRQGLPAWVDTHVAALRAAAADERGGDDHLFAAEEGEALARALADLLAAAHGDGAAIELSGGEWPGFLDALLGDTPVNRRTAPGARLFVFGPLEARLLSFDLVVLAGLDEGLWPITTRADPWLSRPMRRDMALEAPERRIGLSAHDFAQGAAAGRVVLARAARSGGTPTVPSRLLQRLITVIGPAGVAEVRAAAADLLAWARRIDRPEGPPRPVGRPAPTPPVASRPTQLSVTEIETWIRDPYAVYARRILRLEPLDPIGLELGAGDRGTLVHAVLEAFVVAGHPFAGAEAEARFAAIVEEKLADWDAFPEVVALWRPRLLAIGRWWLAQEAARARGIVERATEVKGRLDLTIDGLPFTLTGRADRIDLDAEGRVVLLDYKTGRPPSEKAVQSLLSPQLALEAAMVAAGGFDRSGETRFSGREIAEIAYVHLPGGPVGGSWEVRGRADKGGLGPADLAAAARERLEGLVRHFRRAETGWPSRPRVQFERERSGPYDHLARVAEWAAGEAAEEGEG